MGKRILSRVYDRHLFIELWERKNWVRAYPDNTRDEDVKGRTIVTVQRTRIFKANGCLKVHIVHFKLASSISE